MAQQAALARTAAARALLAVLLVAPSGSAYSPDRRDSASLGECNLTGTWVSESGSKMTISPTNYAGQFTGSYLTAVAATQKCILASVLHGSQHCTSEGVQPTFGFIVSWKFSDSTSVFVGQCFVDGKEEILRTTWLLRQQVDTPAEDWKATRVGKDVFRRAE